MTKLVVAFRNFANAPNKKEPVTYNSPIERDQNQQWTQTPSNSLVCDCLLHVLHAEMKNKLGKAGIA
jgi:hypothetical protein